MPNCDAAASAGIRRRKPPVAHVVLGGSATVPHLPWLYRTPHSNRSVLQLLRYQASLIYRTAVYGPVCTVVWEGRSREAPPYPDASGLLLIHRAASTPADAIAHHESLAPRSTSPWTG